MIELYRLARDNGFTLARSGTYYLLADRWGAWCEIDGSTLLTAAQVRHLILADRRKWAGTAKERHQATMDFLNMAKADERD